MSPHALPMRQGGILVADLIDVYMAHYSGRDETRVQRLAWWSTQLAGIALQDLSDDHVHAALEGLAERPARYYAGKDADGQRIYKAKKNTRLAAATVNRYHASLSAVVTWAVKRRIAPKGYVHPCRSVERRPEDNARTRFLSDDECRRLLDACRASSWPRLYLLVLMALTTGARKGELSGLTWADIDLERAEAFVARTKNGESRVLPLTQAVVDELCKFKAGPETLVFRSPRKADCVFAFEPKYLQALRAAKIEGATFHTLRHSAASMLARNGRTLLEIADVLGHRQLAMTKRYSHLATSHKAAMVASVMGGLR